MASDQWQVTRVWVRVKVRVKIRVRVKVRIRVVEGFRNCFLPKGESCGAGYFAKQRGQFIELLLSPKGRKQ